MFGSTPTVVFSAAQKSIEFVFAFEMFWTLIHSLAIRNRLLFLLISYSSEPSPRVVHCNLGEIVKSDAILTVISFFL